jgi:hypothetical protein
MNSNRSFDHIVLQIKVFESLLTTVAEAQWRRPGDGEASRGDPRVLGRFELDLTSAIFHFWSGSFFGSIPVPVLGGEVLRPFRTQTAVSSADP